MSKMTLDEWAKRTHSMWELHGTDVTTGGYARVTFLYRANHHGEVATFDGPDSIKAKQIWQLGRMRADVERLKREYEIASHALAEMEKNSKPAARRASKQPRGKR